ncbi:(Lyso)-N-acylphosphatidylethanolamine lipase-like [Coccinella septempunctata]|uniref:(Lyso)-N-acylphosphatidylethanolamine lipase-like n=1 Tax=Coccinella septempunctata TaxID=41139 RepID=UPI001D07BA99|nr:(Lyso)-N-acylphosphatidylethanolamine lipase-like [Coccinella septempunctata]
MDEKQAIFECKLVEVEKKILSVIPSYKSEFVPIDTSFGTDEKIWTVSVNTESSNTPLVLLHGFAASLGFWCLNFEPLSRERPLYAIDLLGFGRSSRPDFSENNLEAEKQMVEAIESWRKQMKIEKMILLGHSMGAYLSGLYSMTYPERIQHLILADEWGYTDKYEEPPIFLRFLSIIFYKFNPIGFIRSMGPEWGPYFMQKTRRDIFGKIGDKLMDQSILPKYFYYCNAAREPTGEKAFYNMVLGIGWAKYPLIKRIDKLDKNIPITFLYGSHTWMDSAMGPRIKQLRPDSFVDFHVVDNAGHHIFSENADHFNEIVSTTCRLADQKKCPPKL